nr:transposase [Candidatus Freyarchaeota archaeon]
MNKVRAASPKFLRNQTVKKVSNTIAAHLPREIRGWKLSREELSSTLVEAVLMDAHPTKIAEVLGVADEDTVSYQLRKIGWKCPERLNQEIGTTAAKLLKNRKSRKPLLLLLAVDSTEINYWGKPNLWVHYSHLKKRMVHRFAGASVVGYRRCIPLSLKPIPLAVFPEDIVAQMLNDAEKLGLRVGVVLLDRWFHSVEVVLLLKNRSTPFIIGARKTKRVKQLLQGLDRNRLHILPYTMSGQTSSGYAETDVTLVAFWRKDKGWVTLACWGVTAKEARMYSLRWGIETCFRMIKHYRARTCSPSLPLRWLLLLTSTLLYLAYLHSLLLPPPKPGAEETAALSSYEAFAVSTILAWLLTLLLEDPPPLI